MTWLKKENPECFYIQSKNKYDLKWALNVKRSILMYLI